MFGSYDVIAKAVESRAFGVSPNRQRRAGSPSLEDAALASGWAAATWPASAMGRHSRTSKSNNEHLVSRIASWVTTPVGIVSVTRTYAAANAYTVTRSSSTTRRPSRIIENVAVSLRPLGSLGRSG
jgi:hypothetical protein